MIEQAVQTDKGAAAGQVQDMPAAVAEAAPQHRPVRQKAKV